MARARSEGDADVLAIDLPWSERARRTAIAMRTRTGVEVEAVRDDARLSEVVVERAARGALVLVDVPLDGCEVLSAARPRRGVDQRFAQSGVPILPPVVAGSRGPALRARLGATRPDLVFAEIYPYAVLRVLWALRLSGRTFELSADARAIDLAAWWWTYPPKYKRERDLARRRRAVRQVAALLGEAGMAGQVRTVARATHGELDAVCDEYDALLGLVAGIAAVDRSSWSWRASTSHDDGTILTISDASLRARFDGTT